MRYTTRSYWCEDLQAEVNPNLTVTVIEVGEDAEPTGLVDVHGRIICRVKDRPGFIRY